MKYLSWREVYEKANVNQSTSSFQREKFLKFYRYSGSGRHRKYEEGSVDILLLTSTMYAKGNAFEEIVEALEGKYGVQITNDIETQHHSTTTQQNIINDIKATFIEEIQRLEKKVDELINQSSDRDELLMKNIRLLTEKSTQRWWRFWN